MGTSQAIVGGGIHPGPPSPGTVLALRRRRGQHKYAPARAAYAEWKVGPMQLGYARARKSRARSSTAVFTVASAAPAVGWVGDTKPA